MQQRIIPDLESRLRRRCETLVGFHSSSQNSSSGVSMLETLFIIVILLFCFQLIKSLPSVGVHNAEISVCVFCTYEMHSLVLSRC